MPEAGIKEPEVGEEWSWRLLSNLRWGEGAVGKGKGRRGENGVLTLGGTTREFRLEGQHAPGGEPSLDDLRRREKGGEGKEQARIGL